MLDEDESEPNSTDDAALEQANMSPYNVTISSNRDLNVSIIFANVWQFTVLIYLFFLLEE